LAGTEKKSPCKASGKQTTQGMDCTFFASKKEEKNEEEIAGFLKRKKKWLPPGKRGREAAYLSAVKRGGEGKGT